MSRRQGLTAGVVLIVLASCAPAASSGSTTPPSPAATASSSASPPNTASPVLDRLTIAAMRARSYPASSFTLVRTDGDQGGYVNTVVSYQSDSLRVYALVATPDGARPAAGWPVIVLNHGYIDPSTYRTDDASYAQFIAAFARAGDMVVKPDYRGNGQSQGVPEGGHFSPVYAYDLLNLISTLKADPLVDPTRIGLFAHSMGGHEALRAMVVSHDIKAVVFMAGVVGSFFDIFYNWPNSPVTTDVPAIVQQLRNAAIAAHGTPRTDPTFWDSASAINDVSFTTAVVQVNQDVGDTVVPKLFADHLVAALQAAGKSVQYNTYPGDDHQFTQNRAAILANAVAFYKANL